MAPKTTQEAGGAGGGASQGPNYFLLLIIQLLVWSLYSQATPWNLEFSDNGSGRLLGEQSLKGRAPGVGEKSEVRGSPVGRAEGKPLSSPQVTVAPLSFASTKQGLSTGTRMLKKKKKQPMHLRTRTQVRKQTLHKNLQFQATAVTTQPARTSKGWRPPLPALYTFTTAAHLGKGKKKAKSKNTTNNRNKTQNHRKARYGVSSLWLSPKGLAAHCHSPAPAWRFPRRHQSTSLTYQHTRTFHFVP